ncbi:MAG TPA: cation-transporting P-type ATPase [Mycobacteriales bacterium]|nr:cation-transporting P-type ATPase [Mycobacteriales bacterium]
MVELWDGARDAEARSAEPPGLDIEVQVADAGEPLPAFLRRLRTSANGLSDREAHRRLLQVGPNMLPPPAGSRWLRDLSDQLVHPLALVLWAAAALAWLSGTHGIAAAIVAVIVVNALFAFVQEQQAERAAEALNSLLPASSVVIRDGVSCSVAAAELVPGDLLVIEEGDRISADARLVSGDLEVDMSAVTGESMPVDRSAGPSAGGTGRWMSQTNLVLSGTLCTAGEARALVFATGSHTELGRIAALSQRVTRDRSPLERQVRTVAWLIAAVGTVVGALFMPLGLLAGLSAHDSFLFAVGLLVANVPEGLLPTITLALAVGVRSLAGRGAVVKRLSAVETLGATTVICTDKTGTLTLNRMAVVRMWTPATGPVAPGAPGAEPLVAAIAACSTVVETAEGPTSADATELALFELTAPGDRRRLVEERDAARVALFRFSSERRRMSVVQREDAAFAIYAKGAVEAVLPRCADVVGTDVAALPTDGAAAARDVADDMARDGLRVLAIASRRELTVVADADAAERDLVLLGVVGLLDPPRPEVPAAIAACHDAGIRIHVVTGDNGATAAHIARDVGIGRDGLVVISGDELDAMTEPELDEVLARDAEIVFARSSPEAKLRIADALRALGHVVAMTGDGVNDAPALHRADIGVAMGLSGTDVARESATMVLTDDNFATIAAAVEEGRRVYANVRKFILYIFAHATPEIVPFLVFALAGGLVPLPLTVVQILAIDLGTETLPALALGREGAEPGTMSAPPRPRSENVVTRPLLTRAWLLLGGVSAALVCGAFFLTLQHVGWHPGAATGRSSPLHHGYQEATTATFVGIVACQLGTAWAARRDRARIRDMGIWSNRLLLAGVAFEVGFTAAVVTLPGLSGLLGMAVPPPLTLAVIATFPFIVWAADELRRRLATRDLRP